MSGRPAPTLFDRVAFEWMPPARYLKVHPYWVDELATGKRVRVDPRLGNPYSTGRLAQHVAGHSGPAAVAMSYVASTGAAALFEALFRNAPILPGHRVYLEPAKLANWCLTELTLVRPVEVFPAGLPERKMTVTSAHKDAAWRRLISTGNHSTTWPPAIRLAAELHADGKTLGGITWNSIQCPGGGAVYLLYDPPNGPGLWTDVHTTRLESGRGQTAIRRALSACGYTWINTGWVDHFGPSPGDL
ncbi:MAG: hypothetical protein EPN36_14490 [Rhodanobacteraceae bacterium]|nr:MAG: hypothetical protein EPN36_14490 [Rhodanobacteraceae bacterium]